MAEHRELKVVARNAGHYDNGDGKAHRRTGDPFVLTRETDFAASWMAPIGWTPAAPAAPDSPAPTPAPAPAPTPAPTSGKGKGAAAAAAAAS